MSGIENLMRFLDPDPVDAGCDETFSHLDDYVEQILDGVDAAARQPAVAAHLRSCPPCLADCEGLLAAAREAAPSFA